MPPRDSAKRRKLDHVTDTLRKPFKSPLRSAQSRPLQGDNADQASVAPGRPHAFTPSALVHTVGTAGSTLNPAISNAPRSTLPAPPLPAATPLRRHVPFLSSRSLSSDPEVHAAQKVISNLQLQIKKAQNDVDILQQAHELSVRSTDTALNAVTEKWRTAAQAVADELFEQVKERVQRMGGVGAWREMEQRKHDRLNGGGNFPPPPAEESDYEDCEFDSQGEELPEEEQEYRKKVKKQARKEMMDAADLPDEREVGGRTHEVKAWQEDGKEDDTFTMDMMLRSLNIDLDAIGFDKELQRWT